MHLLITIPSLGPGGAERVISQLANHWASNQHKVSIVSLVYQEQATSFYPLDPRIDLIPIPKIGGKKSIISKWGRVMAIVKRIRWLRGRISALEPDCIVSFIDMTNISTGLANFNLNIPLIVSERTHPRHHKISGLAKLLRRLLYPKAASVVVQTQSVAHYFKYLKNIQVIPNPVFQAESQKLGMLPKVNRIVSVGRLCPFKGFDTLIQAFSIVSNHHPELELIIYGEGREREHLKELIKTLRLQDKVQLPGVVSNIQAQLVKADLFIFPSHYEGFPNALCEAMAVGLPVIASNCSGNVDIIREGVDGRLFPIGNSRALAQLMLELLEDKAQRQRLSLAARQISKRFHPEQVLALWDQSIQQAAEA